MSDPSPDVAGLIAEASQLQIFYSVVISATVLYFYDYALTLSTEISEIWNSKFSGAQALFFLTRYSFMVSMVVSIVSDFIPNPSAMLGRVLSLNLDVWIPLPQIGLYGLLTLRTYAIYRKNQTILITLGFICVAIVAFGVYLRVGFSSASEVGSSVGPSARVQLASVVLTLFLDIVVFTLTFAKTIHQAIEMRKLGLGNGLGYFILRDGTMYFLAKLVFGVVATTIFFVPASGAIGNWVGIIIHMSDVLTIILINRLVLNLRRVSHIQEGNVPTLGPIGTIQEPAFATYSILGNLGAPLRMGEEDKHDDDVTEEVNIDDGAEVVEEREIGNHTEIIEEPRFPSEV